MPISSVLCEYIASLMAFDFSSGFSLPSFSGNMSFKKSITALLALTSSGSSQSATDYKANAEASFNALQTWYNTTSGLWNTCGW